MEDIERLMLAKCLGGQSKNNGKIDLVQLADAEILPAHVYLPTFKAKKIGLFEAHYFPGYGLSSGKPEFKKGSEILLIPQDHARDYPIGMPKVYFKVTDVLERPSKEHEESDHSDQSPSLLIASAPYDLFMSLNPKRESPMAIDRKDLQRVFNSMKEYF